MTIFSTPILTALLRLLFRIGMKLTGWKIDNTERPKSNKAIIVAAPHTSNWDFMIMLALALELRYELHWIGKASLFKGPMGPFARWFGGIPVDRSKRTNMVEQIAENFKEREELFIVIAPEGTRSKVTQWKSGFYHMANLGDADIILAYLNGPNKRCGVRKEAFKPTGDYEQDIIEIQAFYQQHKGINPEQ